MEEIELAYQFTTQRAWSQNGFTGEQNICQVKESALYKTVIGNRETWWFLLQVISKDLDTIAKTG